MFSHDTCHAAEKGNSDSQVFFVQRSQQAKLGVCFPGPEGRNTAHFLAFDGLRLLSVTDFDEILLSSVLKLTLDEPNYKEKKVN